MTKTLIPQPRYSKTEIFKKHVSLTTNSDTKLLLIGDSLISNLSYYPDIWEEYFRRYKALNLGVGGDKVQHVLWRIHHLVFPKSISHIFILACTNNLEEESPDDIAQGIILCGTTIKRKMKSSIVNILALLPRDNCSKIQKIFTINSILENECSKNNLIFLPLDHEWTKSSYELNTTLYHSDHLHLNRSGNVKLSKHIIKSFDSPEFREVNNSSSNSSLNTAALQLYSTEFPPLSSVNILVKSADNVNNQNKNYARAVQKVPTSYSTSMSKTNNRNVKMSRVCKKSIKPYHKNVTPLSCNNTHVPKYTPTSLNVSSSVNTHTFKSIHSRHSSTDIHQSNNRNVKNVRHVCGNSQFVSSKIVCPTKRINVYKNISTVRNNVSPIHSVKPSSHRSVSISSSNPKYVKCPVKHYKKINNIVGGRPVMSKFNNVHHSTGYLDNINIQSFLYNFFLFSHILSLILLLIIFITNNIDGEPSKAKTLHCSTIDDCRYFRYSIVSSWCKKYSNRTYYGNLSESCSFLHCLIKPSMAGLHSSEQIKFFWQDHILSTMQQNYFIKQPKGKCLAFEPYAFILFLIFLCIKRKKNRGHLFLFMHLILLKIIMKKIASYNMSSLDDLKFCSNKSFFSIESIGKCERLHSSELKCNLLNLAFCKLKFNHHTILFKYIILLSGDIN